VDTCKFFPRYVLSDATARSPANELNLPSFPPDIPLRVAPVARPTISEIVNAIELCESENGAAGVLPLNPNILTVRCIFVSISPKFVCKVTKARLQLRRGLVNLPL
jgi:hypothetical protein